MTDFPARADLYAVREIAGSDEEYRNIIWRARRRNQPSAHSRWKWPVQQAESIPSNVKPLRAKGAG